MGRVKHQDLVLHEGGVGIAGWILMAGWCRMQTVLGFCEITDRLCRVGIEWRDKRRKERIDLTRKVYHIGVM